jgi:hypothetical protein
VEKYWESVENVAQRWGNAGETLGKRWGKFPLNIRIAKNYPFSQE